MLTNKNQTKNGLRSSPFFVFGITSTCQVFKLVDHFVGRPTVLPSKTLAQRYTVYL